MIMLATTARRHSARQRVYYTAMDLPNEVKGIMYPRHNLKIVFKISAYIR